MSAPLDRDRITELGLQVGIPWRPTPDRLPLFHEVRRFYESLGFEVVTSDTREASFQAEQGRPIPSNVTFDPAAARNRLVFSLLRPDARVMILSDADTTPEPAVLYEAIAAVLLEGSSLSLSLSPSISSHRLHLPYHLYRRVGPRPMHEPEYVVNAASGVLVFHPEVWEALNGQDEMFHGWGWEDTAFILAHETLLGPVVRHAGTVMARQHSPAPRGGVRLNQSRYLQYFHAHGDQERMRQLIGLPAASGLHSPLDPASDPAWESAPTERSLPLGYRR